MLIKFPYLFLCLLSVGGILSAETFFFESEWPSNAKNQLKTTNSSNWTLNFLIKCDGYIINSIDPNCLNSIKLLIFAANDWLQIINKYSRARGQVRVQYYYNQYYNSLKNYVIVDFIDNEYNHKRLNIENDTPFYYNLAHANSRYIHIKMNDYKIKYSLDNRLPTPESVVSLRHLFAHELGHVLGLSDIYKNIRTIMNPNFSRSFFYKPQAFDRRILLRRWAKFIRYTRLKRF